MQLGFAVRDQFLQVVKHVAAVAAAANQEIDAIRGQLARQIEDLERLRLERSLLALGHRGKGCGCEYQVSSFMLHSPICAYSGDGRRCQFAGTSCSRGALPNSLGCMLRWVSLA